jgi:hypothetical protein
MIADVSKQVALITGRVLHQGTGEPILGRIHITAREGDVVDKVLEDGTFVISGQLERLFPELSLHDYTLNMTIRAESPQFRTLPAEFPQSSSGVVQYSHQVNIPQGANFDPEPPTAPDPLINLGTIRLPVDPQDDPTADPQVFQKNMEVTIRGRVVQASDPDIAIGGATVQILQNGSVTNIQTSSDGRYSLDNIIVKSPATISCSAPNFQQTKPRNLLIDFSKLVNEEDFRLHPSP